MRAFILTIALLTGTTAFGQTACGHIIGSLYDMTNKESVFDATVIADAEGKSFSTQTDLDGYFCLMVPASVEKYRVRFIIPTGTGDDTIYLPELVEISPNYIRSLGTVQYIPKELTVCYYSSAPDALKLEPGVKISADDWSKSPAKSDKVMIGCPACKVLRTDDGTLVFRGARKGDMIFYLDGVKMNEMPRIPSAAIGYVMVYSGALPARYGDTTDGVIVMETFSYTDMFLEWQSKKRLQQ